MRALLTYALVAGSAFWSGVAITEARKPVVLPKVVRPVIEPAVLRIPYTAEGLAEIQRTCRARMRSAMVGPK